MSKKPFIGQARRAVEMIVDPDSFQENLVGNWNLSPQLGVAALVGTATLEGKPATIITNNAQATNPKYPVVYLGIIGLEEAYKMALAVYYTMEADQDKPLGEKRPLILVVDTPGNAPGKVEEIIGMNKATGGYQLALAEARKAGHPTIAIVVGRAVSGGFLCHGLQADRILSLSSDYSTMIHVMPLTSIARITKMDIERLTELSTQNPVFAAGPEFFYRLGGVEELLDDEDTMRERILFHVNEAGVMKETGRPEELGPMSRGEIGAERAGRGTRKKVLEEMNQEFDRLAEGYLK